MRKLPLADQLPYKFYPPRLEPFWLWAAHYYINHLMRKEQRVEDIEIAGTEHLAPLLASGDGVMITPNHPDHADCGVVFELARRVQKPFYYMAAYQIFTGIGRVGLPRIGVFPVDREGSDLTAFKTGVDVLAKAQNPLVIFPEGEIYYLSDRLTPLREGAAVLAATAAKKLADAGKTVRIVPAAIKYRFLEGHDPLPKFHALLDRLEAQFTWRKRPEQSLIERIYRYAEGMLGLKELEYTGSTQGGTLKDRIVNLRNHILDQIEDRRLGKRKTDAVPVRVKELRRACLDALADAKTTPEEAEKIRHDLDDLFGVIQLFSYPGDYIRECPTVERVAEIMMKLEEDCLSVDMPTPRAARRAILQLGEPIDVKTHIDRAGGRLRNVGPALTAELETRMQGLLDAIGPGRAIDLAAHSSKPSPQPAETPAGPQQTLQSSSA